MDRRMMVSDRCPPTVSSLPKAACSSGESPFRESLPSTRTLRGFSEKSHGSVSSTVCSSAKSSWALPTVTNRFRAHTAIRERSTAMTPEKARTGVRIQLHRESASRPGSSGSSAFARRASVGLGSGMPSSVSNGGK
jgi:hypothetical protein